jgi:hypothetical protein
LQSPKLSKISKISIALPQIGSGCLLCAQPSTLYYTHF